MAFHWILTVFRELFKYIYIHVTFKYTDSHLLGRKVCARIYTQGMKERESTQEFISLSKKRFKRIFQLLQIHQNSKFYITWSDSFQCLLLTFCQLAKPKCIKSNVKFWHNHKEAYNQNSQVLGICECHLETLLGKGSIIVIFTPGLQKTEHYKATWRKI
jgi:hypothetical protein